MADHQKTEEEKPRVAAESQATPDIGTQPAQRTEEGETQGASTKVPQPAEHGTTIEMKDKAEEPKKLVPAPTSTQRGGAKKVDEEKLKSLIDMGFDANISRRALEQTEDMEEAVNLIMIIMENGEGNIRAPTKDSVKELRYKMVIVVRGDLKMTPGKVAAQVGHGVLAAYKLALAETPKEVHAWEEIGQMKAVVRCDNQKDLMDVYHNARKQGLPAEYIQDAGRTQVEPGSVTVCAVGPARAELVDQVTGHLKLY